MITDFSTFYKLVLEVEQLMKWWGTLKLIAQKQKKIVSTYYKNKFKRFKCP